MRVLVPPIRCLPQGFSIEKVSYFCFRVLLVKNRDLKKISRKTPIRQDLFSLFFLYQMPLFNEHISHGVF